MSEKPNPNAELGSPELPTIGSVCHGEGCKPCVFQGSCKNGVECQFCHLCEPKLKKRGRWNLKRRKNKAELEQELVKKFGSSAEQRADEESEPTLIIGAEVNSFAYHPEERSLLQLQSYQM